VKIVHNRRFSVRTWLWSIMDINLQNFQVSIAFSKRFVLRWAMVSCTNYRGHDMLYPSINCIFHSTRHVNLSLERSVYSIDFNHQDLIMEDDLQGTFAREY
jgi:hypothetical protein